MGEPKSYVLLASGIMLELTSAEKTTVSLVASPIINFPVVVKDPDTVTVSPESGVIVFTFNVLICVVLVRYINIIVF